MQKTAKLAIIISASIFLLISLAGSAVANCGVGYIGQMKIKGESIPIRLWPDCSEFTISNANGSTRAVAWSESEKKGQRWIPVDRYLFYELGYEITLEPKAVQTDLMVCEEPLVLIYTVKVNGTAAGNLWVSGDDLDIWGVYLSWLSRNH